MGRPWHPGEKRMNTSLGTVDILCSTPNEPLATAATQISAMPRPVFAGVEPAADMQPDTSRLGARPALMTRCPAMRARPPPRLDQIRVMIPLN